MEPAAADVVPGYSMMGLRATEVILPATLAAIGDGAFAATGLETIEVPATVTRIGEGAFAGCAELRSVSLPAGLREIAPLTFKECKSLTDITLPSSVEAIDSCAFAGCGALAEVGFPASLERIGARAFEGTALTAVDLEGSGSLRSVGGFAFAHIPTLTAATLPPGATRLGEGLFFDCAALGSVALPEGIDELPAYVLKGTSLTDAEGAVTADVTRIGSYALYGNKELSSLTLPEGLEAIGDRALAGMTALNTLDASRLRQLPMLGEDVFAGTASKDVALIATEDMLPLLEVADQWKEFNVIAYSSADETIADGALSRLLLRYDGTTIHITAAQPLSGVDVYDLAGRLIAHRDVEPAKAETTVAVGERRDQIVILRITPADGSHPSIAKLKL